MYLINVKQQVEGRPGLKEGLLDRRYEAMSLKDLADWCHTFIRACGKAGWRRDAPSDRPEHVEANRKEGFTLNALEQFMVLRREGSDKVITIEIFPAEPVNAAMAARHFTL